VIISIDIIVCILNDLMVLLVFFAVKGFLKLVQIIL
jgi:hypothetical protein